MAPYIDQYLEDAQRRSGRTPEQLMDRLSAQVFGMIEALSHEVQPRSLFATFLGEWARRWVKVWAGLVCAPPRAQIEAATLWELSEPQVLAGFELAALFRAEGYDRAIAGAFHAEAAKRPGSRTILCELQDLHDQGNPGRVSKFIEDGATWLRDETRNNVANIAALLPVDRTWVDDPRAHSTLICALRNESPVTAAMGWRLVVELRRCRTWSDTSVDDELKRLRRDRTSQILASWDGLVWVADLLWREYRKLIDAQAKAEGKIDRKEAETNSKVALRLVTGLLDSETAAVARARSEPRAR